MGLLLLTTSVPPSTIKLPSMLSSSTVTFDCPGPLTVKSPNEFNAKLDIYVAPCIETLLADKSASK